MNDFATDINVGGTDTISRAKAIEALETVGYDFSDSELSEVELEEVCGAVGDVRRDMIDRIKQLPSAQPERRCVNCGRTVNNGGWYEDGRTRCPIEEHYALPKDGYCHLWEKRKDWEDDYVKRAEEGEK